MTVRLACVGNPDHGQYCGEGVLADTSVVNVADFSESSRVCREYIEANDLGGGNWTGGQIKQGGKHIANVSYNGRIWDAANKAPLCAS